MRRDFGLYQLGEDEFEAFAVRICEKWLGPGVTPFATGPDGGRDGKFHGTAACFPSKTSPLVGHVVIQAKHSSSPDKSCSDREFQRLLKKEHPKIRRLRKEGVCDHYLLFTNRKYTGGADEKLIKELKDLGLKSAHIIGTERLNLVLDGDKELQKSLPNWADKFPFQFTPDDFVEVIYAFHDYVSDDAELQAESAYDFEKLKLVEKNKLNGVGDDYYKQVIVNDSMPHFGNIDAFLKNPRNRKLADLYYDAADELKSRILVNRTDFENFDQIFLYMNEQIQQRRDALKGKRRLVSILLHYMYCQCDIGSKQLEDSGDVAIVDA